MGRQLKECLIFFFCVSFVKQNFAQKIELECTPIDDCPIAMKLVTTKKYAPETVEFLRTSHCGHSKESGPLVWCPNSNSCSTPNGENGVCVDLTQCASLLGRSTSTADLHKYRCNKHLENTFHVCCTNQGPQSISNGLNDEEEMQNDQPRFLDYPYTNPEPLGPGTLTNRFHDDYPNRNKHESGRPWFSFQNPGKNNHHPTYPRPEVNINHHETTSKMSARGYWKPSYEETASHTHPTGLRSSSSTSKRKGDDATSKTNARWEPEMSSTGHEETTISRLKSVATSSTTSTSKYGNATSKIARWEPEMSSTGHEETTASRLKSVATSSTTSTSRYENATSKIARLEPEMPSTGHEETTASRMRSVATSSTTSTSRYGNDTSKIARWEPEMSSTGYKETTASRMRSVATSSTTSTSRFGNATSKIARWEPEMSSTGHEESTTSRLKSVATPSTTSTSRYENATSKIARWEPKMPSTGHDETTTSKLKSVATSSTTSTSRYESATSKNAGSDSDQNISSICGKQTANSDRIIGGSVVDLGQYPWAALLQYNGKKGRKFGCGGTLINQRYVLTAAHCVHEGILQTRNLRFYRVLLGEYDTRNATDCIFSPLGNKCADPPIYFGVDSVSIHEQFDNVNALNDIALIRLDRDVEFTDYIKPICLPDSNFTMKVNESFTVAGWGETSFTDGGSPVLMKARLPLVVDSDCERYGTVKALSAGQVCAGVGNGVDTCTGDSGGPMMVERTRNFENVAYLVGVVSYGLVAGCGRAPSVNTFVPYYVDWIFRNVR